MSKQRQESKAWRKNDKGQRLETSDDKGQEASFVGTLLETINRGKERIAIFSVPSNPESPEVKGRYRGEYYEV